MLMYPANPKKEVNPVGAGFSAISSRRWNLTGEWEICFRIMLWHAEIFP